MGREGEVKRERKSGGRRGERSVQVTHTHKTCKLQIKGRSTYNPGIQLVVTRLVRYHRMIGYVKR